MTKPALAAFIALALSLSLAGQMANAQASSTTTTTRSHTMAPGVPTTFSAPQQADRARRVNVGSTPAGWQSTGQGVVQLAPGGRSRTTTTSTTTSTTTTATTDTTAVGVAGKKPVDDTILVTQSHKKLVAQKAGWEKFYDYIDLKPGQDQMPLTLTVTNGSPAFQGVRIFLSGQQLATEKDFKQNVLQMKMDGTLSPGQNQFTIEGYGQPGATLNWKLNTQRAVLTAAKPDPVAPGETITITGRNFSNKTGVTQVWVGDKIAKVTSGNAKTLTVVVPMDAVQGEQKLVAAVGGIPTKPLKITVKGAAPELGASDLYGAPPGYSVTISGKGFSTKPEDNVVTINGTQAQVTSCSSTSITFLMPELPNVYGAVPLSVKTNGIASKNNLNITPSNRLMTAP